MTETAAEHASAQSRCPVSQFAVDFNPFGGDYLQDPYPVYDRARREEPVFYSPELGYWVVTRYDDIREIFRDTESFSASVAAEPITPPCQAAMEKLIAAEFVPRSWMVDEDPPLHTKHRRVMRKGVTEDKIENIEPYARRFVTNCLDAIVKRGRADLVSDLTFQVPAMTAFVLMGVPDVEVERVKGYASRLALWVWGKPTEEQQLALADELIAYMHYARQHVERLIQNPGEDYMSNPVKAWLEAGNDELWDKPYLATIMQSHMYAAHETTTNAAANGFKVLLEHRDQWDMLCQDPSLIPNAVEEILRYVSSVPTWRRITTRPVTVGGVNIPAGERILLATASANHDESIFADPETFDITREGADRHLSFGWGIHLCLGQALARMEMRVMLEETTRRLPHLQLVPDQPWVYSPNTSFRGPEHVLVQWDPSQNPEQQDRP